MSARRTVSIRRSLLVNVVLVVVMLGAAIVGMSYLGSNRSVGRFSASLLDQTLHRVEIELEGFFLPLERRLLTLRRWGETGMLDLDDPESIERLLQPTMRAVPWVSSVMVADERGRELMLLRDGQNWRSRQTRRDDRGGEVLWREWSDGDASITERTEAVDYDPRERPWYAGAESLSAEIFWTEPYAFFTTGDPGITAAVAFQDPEGRLRVVGVDVSLITISRLTQEIEVHDDGVAFVLAGDGRLIGLPHAEGPVDEAEIKQALLRHPDEFDSPLARAVAKVLVEREDRFGQATRFRGEGEAWWGLVKPFPLGGEREVLIGIGVPESDLLGDLNRQRLWIGLITLAVLGLALARAWVLATRYSRPVEQLVEESERIATGDLEPGSAIDTDVAEVHALAEAHDRMRDGLKTLLRLERDLELARRIQKATLPERLPELEGYDLAAWNEPADQTGGDTYDVIGLPDRAVLLLADATGHGIGPALSVTQVRAMLRMAVRISTDLSRIGTHMNQQLCADLPAGRFITVWLGLLDLSDHTLTTLSGGQAPLLLYRAETDELEQLGADTTPFGLFDSGEIEASTTLTLGPGDIYAVISDGIFESEGPGGDDFGVERTEKVIREHRAEPAAAILERLREAVDAFTEGAPAADDRTIILVKRR